MNVSFGKFILFFLLIFAFSTGHAADEQEKKENVETLNQDMSLIEIFTLTNTLPEELIDLRGPECLHCAFYASPGSVPHLTLSLLRTNEEDRAMVLVLIGQHEHALGLI